METRPPLTPESRRLLGLPPASALKYPWPAAVITVLLGVGPLWLAGYRSIAVLLVVLGFVILPTMRWMERRERKDRERLYHQGRDGFGVVLAVEPAGAQKNDHLVRLELFIAGKRIETFVTGSPLARRGLAPGDDVKVIYDERDPRRCLLLERSRREIIDAIFQDLGFISLEGACSSFSEVLEIAGFARSCTLGDTAPGMGEEVAPGMGVPVAERRPAVRRLMEPR